jgi:hypothetical protein
VNRNYVLYDPEKGEYIQQKKHVDFEEEEEFHPILRQIKEENSVSADSRSTTPEDEVFFFPERKPFAWANELDNEQ